MDKIIYEKDMYIPVREFFINEGFEVRGEVNNCDLCAMKDGQVVVVELKKNLSVDLLCQGVNRQKIGDLVYIAVPKPKRFKVNSKWKDIFHLVRRLELGLIFVTLREKKSSAEIIIHPEPFDRLKSIQYSKRKREKLIKEFNGRSEDLNIGGVTREKLMTAYRENSLYIASCLEKLGPSSAKELKKLGTDEKTYSILYNNHYGWFSKKEKGIYSLSDSGKKALETYRDFVNKFNHILD